FDESINAQNSPPANKKTPDQAVQEIFRLTAETLADFDRCVDEVESIPIQQSISNMTTVKFKKLLDQELNHFSTSKSGDLVSRYIAHTFTEAEICDDQPYMRTSGSSGSGGVVGAAMVGGASGASANSLCRDSHGGSSHSIVGMLKKPPSAITSKLSKLYKFKKPQNLRKKISLGILSSHHHKSSGGSSSGSGGHHSDEPNTSEYFGVHSDRPRELVEVMHDIDKWGLDVFSLRSLTKDRPLTAVLYTILKKERNLISCLDLDERILLRYCAHLERNYNNSNPYHNVSHAADVTQSMHVLLMTKTLPQQFNDLEVFSALFASAVHDVNHPGVTNQFLINTCKLYCMH
uniref:3',5'-cyclic-AMP phosphodiesterase n=1 Tax=Romanomermis culicivorax TaxID=13658 RepID=A0A915KX44_ROMCU